LAVAFLLPAILMPVRRRRLRVWTTNLRPDRALLPRCLASLLAVEMAVVSLDWQVMANQAVLYSALTTDTWGSGGTVTTYQYDANGSVTRKVSTGGRTETVEYGYDLANHLISAVATLSVGGVQTINRAAYTYNFEGIRVRSEFSSAVNGTPQGGSTNVF